MKFEVNRQFMLEAAKCAAKIAPSNSPVDVLNGILVECSDDTGEVFLTATNHEVSIQLKVIASVEESGATLVNARMLTGMMSLLPSELVTMSSDRPEVLKVSGDRCKYNINCPPAKSYPKPVMPFPEESVIMTGICSLAKRTTFLVGNNDSKPALQCVKITLTNNAVHAAASDGFARMMLVKEAAESTDKREFLLPGRSLSILASISKDSDVFEVGDIGREVVFVRGDMIFTIRKLVTGDYMDTSTLLKGVKPVYAAVADAGMMRKALDLISVSALAGDMRKPINLVMSGSKSDSERAKGARSAGITLRCSGDRSAGSTVVPASVSKETPDTGFFYDVSALLRSIQVLSGKVRLEIDSKGIMLVKSRSEVYLQSPVRPPAEEAKPAAAKEKASAKGAEGMKEVA